MNAEELAGLIDAYRDGTISEEDARRLAAAIREGGETSRRIVGELRFEGTLARALEREDGESFARSFRERLAAEESEVAFVRAFEGRRLRAAAPRPGGGWIPWVFAAGALLAFAWILTSTGDRSPAPRIADRSIRQNPDPSPEPPRVEPRAPERPKTVTPRPEERSIEIPGKPVPPQVEPRPEPRIEIEPRPEPPREEKPAPAPTQAVLATVTGVQGNVFRLDGAARVALTEGQGLLAGQGMECAGAKSAAVATFIDGTRIELGPETLVREIVEKKGKRVVVAKGTLVAQVARQPADGPMVFATPHAEARVVGTSLRLEVDSQTRLEVSEGKVRLTRNGAKGADVAAGSFAVTGPGVEPASRILHPDDVVLLAPQARIVGDEWALVPDRNASGGSALQVVKNPFKPIDHVDTRPSFAVFTFHASAEREYRLWVRSTSLSTGDKWLRELVTVEPQGCTMSQKSSYFGTAPTTAFVFNGISSWNGYAWSSGIFEEARPDKEPILVRFAKTGPQTLRLFTVHPSIRIDAIWLSARQSSRPAAKTLPPVDGR